MPKFTLHPYDPAQADSQRALIARHELVGFSGPSSSAAKWYGGFAPQVTHFLKAPQGDVVASVGLLDDQFGGGLWCGGKQLSGLSYTSLVVEPAARGRGVATALNHAVVQEAARRGHVLAILYPASLELYRKAGFELVGDYEVLSVNPATIRPAQKPSSVAARPGGPQDRDAMMALRDRLLAQRRATGAYARDALSWQMLFQTTSDDPAEVICFVREGVLVGYLILDMLAGSPAPLSRCIWVQDWMATDFEVRCALVQMLAGFGTVHSKITWQPQASEDLAEAMTPQPTYLTPEVREPLAARIIEPVKALGGRGYHPRANGVLRLAIHDALLDRKYDLALDVTDGEARVGPVKRPGLPRLALGINALAPMLFGYRSANALARMGWVEGPAQALDLADHLFQAERSVTGDFY